MRQSTLHSPSPALRPSRAAGSTALVPSAVSWSRLGQAGAAIALSCWVGYSSLKLLALLMQHPF
jgi:hypothetical protein